MLYSPAHIEPRRIDTLMGQIDIAPTVLGLNAAPRTFGCDGAGDRYTALPLDGRQERLAIAYFQTAYELFSRHSY